MKRKDDKKIDNSQYKKQKVDQQAPTSLLDLPKDVLMLIYSQHPKEFALHRSVSKTNQEVADDYFKRYMSNAKLLNIVGSLTPNKVMSFINYYRKLKGNNYLKADTPFKYVSPDQDRASSIFSMIAALDRFESSELIRLYRFYVGKNNFYTEMSMYLSGIEKNSQNLNSEAIFKIICALGPEDRFNFILFYKQTEIFDNLLTLYKKNPVRAPWGEVIIYQSDETNIYDRLCYALVTEEHNKISRQVLISDVNKVQDLLNDEMQDSFKMAGLLANPSHITDQEQIEILLTKQSDAYFNLEGFVFNRNADAQQENKKIVNVCVKYSNMDDVTIEGCDLTNANFTGSSLKEAVIEKTDMTGSNLQYTDCEECHITDSTLNKCDLSFSNLNNATLNNVNLEGAICNQTIMSAADMMGSTDLSKAYVQGIIFFPKDITSDSLEHYLHESRKDIYGEDKKQALTPHKKIVLAAMAKDLYELIKTKTNLEEAVSLLDCVNNNGLFNELFYSDKLYKPKNMFQQLKEELKMRIDREAKMSNINNKP